MDDLEIDEHVEPSIFGEEGDDPFAVPPPLAPLPPPGEDTTDIQQQNGVLNLDGVNEAGAEGADKEKTKTKKKNIRPRVHLNEARLCSQKGIAAMKNLCVDINFKGKGHEVSDLNKLLQQYEHWAQCLMPSWPFENVVKKCEKLGTKRFVKNEVQRLRLNEDEILRGESEGEVDEGTSAGQTDTNRVEEPQQQETQVPQEETQRPAELNEEQLERIRKNRELALARWEAIRQRKLLAEASQSETTTEAPETTQNPSEEHNFNDVDSNVAAGTDGINEGGGEAENAMEAQRMNGSPTEESHEDQPHNEESNETSDPDFAELMDTDSTNIHEVSEEQPMQNSRPVEKYDTLIENGTLDTDSIDQLDTHTKTDGTSEIPTENANLNETSEIEYPGEIADANPTESAEVELCVRPNNETNLVTDEKQIVEQAVADEIDQIDAEEITEVKTNDTTTDNLDLENGDGEIQDVVDNGSDEMDTAPGNTGMKEGTSADLPVPKEDMVATHSTIAYINDVSDTTTENIFDQMVEMDTES